MDDRIKSARRARLETKRKYKKHLKESGKRMRDADNPEYRACVRCGGQRRSKKFGNKRNGPRICYLCWNDMTQTERKNVRDSF